MFSILSRGFLLLTIIIQILNQTCIQLILKLASKHKTILLKTYHKMIFLIVVFIDVNLVRRSLLYVMYAKKTITRCFSINFSVDFSLSLHPFFFSKSIFREDKLLAWLPYFDQSKWKRKGRRSKLEIHRKRPN